MSGDKPICFYSANIEEFMDPNPKMRWIELNPDLALGKVTEHSQAGLISFKMSIHDKAKDGPISFD